MTPLFHPYQDHLYVAVDNLVSYTLYKLSSTETSWEKFCNIPTSTKKINFYSDGNYFYLIFDSGLHTFRTSNGGQGWDEFGYDSYNNFKFDNHNQDFIPYNGELYTMTCDGVYRTNKWGYSLTSHAELN